MSTKKYANAAERQRAHRQRVNERLAGLQPPLAPPAKARKLARPQRIALVAEQLGALLDEYQTWLAGMPANLASGETAERLQETVDLFRTALDAVEAADPPRGFGR